MKTFIWLITLFMLCNTLVAQDLDTLKKDATRERIVKALYEARGPERDGVILHKNNVTGYTRRNLIKSDFSTLTGLDNSATVGRYSSLTVDKDASTFSFTPVTISANDLTKEPFKWIHSIDFNGTVGSTGLVDLKNWKAVSLSYSATYLAYVHYTFDDAKKPTDRNYTRIYNTVLRRFKEEYELTKKDELEALKHPEFNNNDDLKKAYLDSVSKYEELLTNKLWTSKNFLWFKATANLLSFDNTNYIVTGDTATYKNPKGNALWTPSVLVSGNYYWGYAKGWNFYVSVFLQATYKDSFSDVYNPSEWDKVIPLGDSALVKTDTKNVFISPDENVKRKILPNAGLETVVLLPSFKYVGLGADYTFSYVGLISNQLTHSTGFGLYHQIGLVLSFKDKTGASTINVEPFYQSKNYYRYTLANANLWGAKLSIPFTRLY